MGVPTGTGPNSYPKMVTISVGGALLPATYPAGNAKQFNYVFLADAAAEATYVANPIGVAPVSNLCSGGGSSWENRHH